jgi:hypothetical protein
LREGETVSHGDTGLDIVRRVASENILDIRGDGALPLSLRGSLGGLSRSIT